MSKKTMSKNLSINDLRNKLEKQSKGKIERRVVLLTSAPDTTLDHRPIHHQGTVAVLTESFSVKNQYLNNSSMHALAV
jgi:hypothetical protein